MRGWRGFCAALVPLLSAAAIAGCGSSNSSTSSSSSGSGGASTSSSSSSGSSSASTGSNPNVVALVPSAVKSKGTMTVASDATYAPNEFIASDGKTVIGMDADMMKALAGAHGPEDQGRQRRRSTASSPASQPASTTSARRRSPTPRSARRPSTSSTYFIAGESFFTKAQGGASINSLADLCGHTVAVERGTTEQADAQKQSTKCKAAGKPAVTVLPFADQNGANLALSSGRAQLGFADSPVAEYQVKKSNGQFKLVGASLENAPYGLAVSKSGGLAKPMLAALKVLMQNGQYKTILTHWGVQPGAIPQPEDQRRHQLGRYTE